MKRIAIFASGSGSNFEAIVEATLKGNLGCEVVLLFTDKKDAYVLERAKKFNIPAVARSIKDFLNKEAFERSILSVLKQEKIDFIVLAGYMRLIGPTILHKYTGKIVNIHPSLLPSFPGKDAIQQAMEKGVKITGVTIHYVDQGMDTGPIIAQKAVEITEEDTYETLKEKIQAIEHYLYPETLKILFREDEKSGEEARIK